MVNTMAKSLEQILQDARACKLCKENLPLGPRPVVRAETGSPVLIIGQAPGTKVHASGIPWDDVSGNNLREWLSVDKEVFYDTPVTSTSNFCAPLQLPPFKLVSCRTITSETPQHQTPRSYSDHLPLYQSEGAHSRSSDLSGDDTRGRSY